MKIEFKSWFGAKKKTDNKQNKLFKVLLGENNTPAGWLLEDANNRERYSKFITDEKKGNGVVYSIVSSISDTASELFHFVEVVDSKQEVIDGTPQMALLNTPNDIDSKTSIIRQLMMNLLTVGDAFLYGEMNAVSNLRTALYVLPSAKMKIEKGGITEPIKGFSYKNTKRSTLKEELFFTKDNTMFVRLANPRVEDFHGLSPLTPIIKDVEVLDLAKRLESKLLEEGGVRNIISLSQVPEGRNIEEFVEAIGDQLNSSHGATNQVYLAPLQRIPMGDTATDLALQEVIKNKTEEICNAYGYPTNLFYRDSTFSNLKEAKKEKYTITIPYVNLLCEALTKFLFGEESDLKFVLNTDHIEELKPDYTGVVNAMRGVATVNEIRAYLKLPVIEGGDVLLVNMGQMPLNEVVSQGEGETE